MLVDDDHRAGLERVGGGGSSGKEVLTTAELVDELVVGVNGGTVQRYNLVAFLQTNLCGGGVREDAINLGRHQRTHEGGVGLEHAEEIEVAGQCDAHGLAVADDIDTMCLGNVAIEVGGESRKP